MTFGLLGPLEVLVSGRPVELGGVAQRGLLAALLLNANEPVSVDRLLDEVWGESPPPTAAKMVQIYVSRLRKALPPDVAGRSPLVTERPGYLLTVEADELDLLRFERLVGEARELRSVDAGSAAGRLREALALWRGPALADLLDLPLAHRAAPRLEEARIAALEERVELDLELGRHAELVGELDELVRAHPERERLRGQLMLALYRSGRQTEALDEYRRARATLVDELGIDPGPELQRLETSILRQDPALELPRAAAPPSGEPPHGRRRWAIAVAVVAAAAVLSGTLAIALLHRSPSASVRVQAASLAVLDARTGAVMADTPLGGKPGPVAVGASSLWVGNQTDRTVVKLDPGTRRVVATFGLPEAPTQLAVTGDVVWIANGYSGTVSRIVARYGFVSRPIRLRRQVYGLVVMAASSRALWVGYQDGRLDEHDPETLRREAALSGLGTTNALALGGGSVWKVGLRQARVVRVTERDATVRGSTGVDGWSGVLAFGRGALWVATNSPTRVWRIDPRTGSTTGSAPIGAPPIALVAGPFGVWAACGDGRLYKIDPATVSLERSIQLGHAPAGLALDGRTLYVTVA